MTSRKPDAAGLPIERLRGIGPTSAKWLRAAGITTEAELRALGAARAYRRLKSADPRTISLNMLWGLHAALHGMPVAAVDGATRERLLAELDGCDGDN